jgi:hypothetical protein
LGGWILVRYAAIVPIEGAAMPFGMEIMNNASFEP